MIAGLKGTLFAKTTDHVVVDVHGVRYACAVSLSTLAELGQPGEDVELFVHTHVREDMIALYGFANEEEKRVFLALNSVSGIGPKLALAMLSGLPARALAQAVVNSDLPR
ncbi:MAG: Holliday junction branch migration protein RuvA, partial [Myxococcales bacterium]